MNSKEWLTAQQVCELTGYKYRHFWVYLKRGHIPPPDLNFGRKPLWKRENIEGLVFKGRDPLAYQTDQQVVLPNDQYLDTLNQEYTDKGVTL
jgi:predicted DNA-binding transcriptional regulator AlpA